MPVPMNDGAKRADIEMRISTLEQKFRNLSVKSAIKLLAKLHLPAENGLNVNLTQHLSTQKYSDELASLAM